MSVESGIVESSPVRRVNESVTRWLALATLFVVTATVIIREKPYFGNMDDGLWLRDAAALPLTDFVMSGGHLSFGSPRQSSFLGLWPLYRMAVEPMAFFLVNALVVLLCLVAFWWAFRPLLARSSGAAMVTFLAVAICWPFTADLFFFPSLQEKFIILGAAGLLGWVRLARRKPECVSTWILLALLVPFAFTTKLHIVVFVPGVLLALWAGGSGASRAGLRRARVVASLVIIGASGVLGALALFGDYTRERRGDAFELTRLAEWRFLLVAGVTVAVALAYAFVWRVGLARVETGAHGVCLTFLMTMVGAFLVWDVYQRHLAIVSVMIAGSAASFTVSLGPRARFAVAATALVLAGAWQMYRLPHVFSSLGSFGDFIRSGQAADLAEQETVVYSTCYEARYNYELYAVREGLDGLKFGWLDDLDRLPLASEGTSAQVLVLADHVLCPLAASEHFGAAEEVSEVWQSGRSRGFRLISIADGGHP